MRWSHVRGALLCFGLFVMGAAGCGESDSISGPDSAGTETSSDELFDLDDELGACIFSDASCLPLTEDDCEDANGVFLGIDSICPGTNDHDCDHDCGCDHDHEDGCDHDHDCHCDGECDHDHDCDCDCYHDHEHDCDCDHGHDCDHDHCGCEAMESCGLGYWKNHPGAWPADIDSGEPLGVWFDLPDALEEFADDSLGEALRYPGGNGVSGGTRLLLRDGVVALLNASHSDLNFAHDVEDVLEIVNDALHSLDRRSMQQARNRLKVDDEECPFD